LLPPERKREIAKFIDDAGTATVDELKDRFGVSGSTIRRDLRELNEDGRILRAHGGAVATRPRTPEPPIIERMPEHGEEKKRIGRATADLVQDGETVFLGSGTTTLEVARSLVDRTDLTVITNALNVVNTFAGKSDVTVIVVGGLLRHSELSMIGHIADQVLRELHADKVIMGVRAISIEKGLTNDYIPETMTDRAIIGFAPETIIVADHSKFGRVSTSLLAPITRADKIVTDVGTPSQLVSEIRQLGIEVILA
jgi:DeoR/GlpR family transcriptional regulator of sugar metabolism